MTMPKLILIRGLPGSGKSTIARSMAGYEHYEADMYFSLFCGGAFDGDRLREAHAWCLDATKRALDEGKNVVVANTFSQKWEMQPYLEIDVDISVITALGEFDSIHYVPQKTIDRMRARWEA